MKISKDELKEILKESSLYDPRVAEQDIKEITERNGIEISKPFLEKYEKYLDVISGVVVAASAFYFGSHFIAFLLR